MPMLCRLSPVLNFNDIFVVLTLSLLFPCEIVAFTKKIVVAVPPTSNFVAAFASGDMTSSVSAPSSNITDPSITPSPNAENSAYKTASFVCGIIIVPTALVGITGNFLNIYIFTRRGMICSINTLLAGLAGIDCVLLIISMPTFSLVALNIGETLPILQVIRDALILWGYPVAAMAQNASVWCLMVITLERYVAVVFPLRSRYICTTRNARLALLAVTVTAVTYNVCRFFEYSWQNDGKLCNWLRNDIFYLRFYAHWLYFFMIFLVPFVVLLIFNGFIIKGVRGARAHRAQLTRQESQEHKVALMMVVIILIFLACNSLPFVLNAIESTQPEYCFVSDQCNSDSSTNVTLVTTGPTSTTSDALFEYCYITSEPFYFAGDLNNLLVEINSSVNFFIYYAFSQRFRKYLRRLCPCTLTMMSKNGNRKSGKERRRSAITSDFGFDQHCNNGCTERTSAAERSPMLAKANTKLKMSRTFSERSCPSSQIVV